MAVCGNGADYATLEEAEIDKAELFISCTGSDELNMLSCLFARKMGANHTVARIRNPEYNDNSLGFMRHELHLSMAINPEQLTAQELFGMLKLPSATKIERFSARNFAMIEQRIKSGSALDGITLSEIRALKNSAGSNMETLYRVMDGTAEALEFNVTEESKVTNRPLKEISFKSNVLIAAIFRKGKTIIPTGDDYILTGDRVIVLATKSHLNNLTDILK